MWCITALHPINQNIIILGGCDCNYHYTNDLITIDLRPSQGEQGY